MSLDFSGRNLQGRSFKGQNLTGANFSYADIRGVDFTKTTLIGAKFNYAQAGLQNYRVIILTLVLFVLAIISGAAARFAGGIAAAKVSNSPLVLIILALLFIFIAKRGITADLAAFLAALAGALIVFGAGAGALDLAGMPIGSVGLSLVMRVAWTIAGTLPWALAGALALAIALNLLRNLARLPRLLVSILGIGLWVLAWDKVAAFFQPVGIVVVVFVAVAVGLFGGYLAWRALREDENFTLIRWLTVAIAAMGGTSFENANLMDADFGQATVKSTDFRNANLTRTNFHLVKFLEQARVNNTILIDRKVRNLVVTKRGASQSYQGCNLKGANLVGADLTAADFTEADVSKATFEYAELVQANFTKTQALQTSFRFSRLTGACLEAWNIDSTTQLEDALCEYVYLLDHHQERRPSSGEFAPGEFTKLFQEVLNTVDLIFRNGIDWKAFTYSFNQLQIENEDTELFIQSIANKGDGVVVVKVSVPEHADKAKIHANFTQGYDLALQVLEEKYRAELNSKKEQIAIYRQHQADLKELVQLLASRPALVPTTVPAGKLAVLKLIHGNLDTGFALTLAIGAEGSRPFLESTGLLAPAPALVTAYSRWQSAYRRSLKASRLDIPDTQITNVSRNEFFQECNEAAEKLQQHLNLWLNSETFRPVKEQLLEHLAPSESIRIILQTEDAKVRRLPFQLWDFFDRYLKAEIALSAIAYEQIVQSKSPKNQVRILAILGDSTGIDLRQDRRLLELLDAEVTFLVEPRLQELNVQLWEQPWDILFFAGHSSSQLEGVSRIHINSTDSLTIPQLKHALKKAIEQGLTLAIFNSCDGLGLAANLADLQIPQIIVMREPVPDRVAGEFLKNFLTAFSTGQPLYQSVREAREKLQGLEDQFPCATWLPIICQNPAVVALSWKEF